MTFSTEMSLIPNMERRLATRRPFPDPGPPAEHAHVSYWFIEGPTEDDEDFGVRWWLELYVTPNVDGYVWRRQNDRLAAFERLARALSGPC